MPTFNRELADKVMSRLTPDNWDQDYWMDTERYEFSDRICNTTGCVGGWTLVELGYTPKQVEQESFDIMVDGHPADCDVIAQESLGLTDKQANELFYGDWDWTGDKSGYRNDEDILPFPERLVALKELFMKYEAENNGPEGETDGETEGEDDGS